MLWSVGADGRHSPGQGSRPGDALWAALGCWLSMKKWRPGEVETVAQRLTASRCKSQRGGGPSLAPAPKPPGKLHLVLVFTPSHGPAHPRVPWWGLQGGGLGRRGCAQGKGAPQSWEAAEAAAGCQGRPGSGPGSAPGTACRTCSNRAQRVWWRPRQLGGLRDPQPLCADPAVGSWAARRPAEPRTRGCCPRL